VDADEAAVAQFGPPSGRPPWSPNQHPPSRIIVSLSAPAALLRPMTLRRPGGSRHAVARSAACDDQWGRGATRPLDDTFAAKQSGAHRANTCQVHAGGYAVCSATIITATEPTEDGHLRNDVRASQRMLGPAVGQSSTMTTSSVPVLCATSARTSVPTRSKCRSMLACPTRSPRRSPWPGVRRESKQ
jgi:hypothetical protein